MGYIIMYLLLLFVPLLPVYFLLRFLKITWLRRSIWYALIVVAGYPGVTFVGHGGFGIVPLSLAIWDSKSFFLEFSFVQAVWLAAVLISVIALCIGYLINSID